MKGPVLNEQQNAAAAGSLRAAYDGTMDFPAIVGHLIAAGFESYCVDYRRQTAVYYLPSGESVELALPEDSSPIAATFQHQAIKDAICEAQSGSPGYTYKGFCEKVKAAGCASYIVSFSGRRVVYLGRTAELHVEHFPN